MDNGTQATEDSLLTNENLLAILMESSGEVESALVASNRYSAEDLQSANGVSSAYLQGIVSDIAIWNLFCRRDGYNIPETVEKKKDDAWKKIESLKKGDTILSFTETGDASLPSNEYMEVPDLKNLNLFSDSCRRSLGVRNSFRRGL
jgi:hypothetical protein